MHPSMVWIRMLPQGKTRSVQLPASVVHRSVEGDCLILSAGRSREITQDEWQHIQEHHKDLLPSIQRLDDNSRIVIDDPAEPEDEPEPEPSTDSEAAS